tara:strand:- start:23717 stop:24331 length:615 start_codon:yes stop_codon:yes gene_type:complete
VIKNEEQRRALYDQGLNDVQISQALDLDTTTIRCWRKKRNLPANQPCDRSRTPMRRLLHNLGWGSRSIAKYQSVSVRTVKDWRRTAEPPQTATASFTTQRRGADQLRDLQRRVIRAVGCQLPYDIAADAAAALMLAVIEGEVPLDQIEQRARSFGNRALKEYADAYGPRSLDEEIPGTDGLSGVALLVDDSSSAWLEEMGATVH